MKRTLIAGLALSATLSAQGKQEDRLRLCGTVMKEILDIPDDIPKDLLAKAECLIVFPGVKKAALGVGGSYGRGAMTCRTGAGFDGPWSAPSLMALEGGSIGFQIGGEGTGYVRVLTNGPARTPGVSRKWKTCAPAAGGADPQGGQAGGP